MALIALLAVPATSADARTRRHARSTAKVFPVPSFSAFTPAAADPRSAAMFALSGLGSGGSSEGAFRFTPSGTGSSKRAVTVAVRSRAFSRQQAARAMALPSDGLAPSAYSLGASIGWKRFEVAGEVQRTDGGLLPNGRLSADVGLVFSGKRWATAVDFSGERPAGTRLPIAGQDESWSVGIGGSYALTRRFNVTGGVRYKTQHDQLQSLTDDRRDSQAVYLGTTFKF